MHLIPEAETLAVVADGLDVVHLHRVPPAELVDRIETDFLMVASRPPQVARRTKWEYTPDVWGKKVGLSIKLESGPNGMTVVNGVVRWDVPAEYPAEEVSVILSLSTASGYHAFHSFNLAVRDKADAKPTVIHAK